MKASLETLSRALLSAGAVTLAVWAGWLLIDTDDEIDQASEDLADAAGTDGIDVRAEAEEERAHLRAIARGMAPPDDAIDALDDGEIPPPLVQAQGPITREDAQAGFDYAMRRVERIAGKRRRLRRGEWDALYREANDAFSALSMHLDAQDGDDAAALEAAHRRLQKGLSRVRVRGGKFKD